MFEVELPYPPSINHYWRRVGFRVLICREGRRFRQSVVDVLTARRVNPLKGPLAVEIEVHPPDNRRRDLDNLTKSLLDAMQHGGVYEDDSQIARLTLMKCRPVAGGKTVVRIRCV